MTKHQNCHQYRRRSRSTATHHYDLDEETISEWDRHVRDELMHDHTHQQDVENEAVMSVSPHGAGRHLELTP